MKKKTLIISAALTATLGLGSSSFYSHAAPLSGCRERSYIQNIDVYSNCSQESLTSILNYLKECYPFLQWNPENCPMPEQPIPEQPGTETPGGGLPEVKPPQPEIPETETPGTEKPEESDAERFAAEITRLVNAEREKHGLSLLTLQTDISAAAQVRSQEILSSFSHTRPDGRHFVTALQEQGVSYQSAGENIAWGQKSPVDVMDAWMNSDGHRANILSEKFTSIGIGYYQDDNGINYWTQLFTG